MPNIEIHGYGDDSTGLRQGDTSRAKVWEALEDAKYKHGVVVTVCTDLTRDSDGNRSPFFRICYTLVKPSDAHNIEDIIDRLQPLGFDIELQELAKFIPKKTVAKV